jgi:hypothetical protein
MFSSSTYLTASNNISFFLVAELNSIVYKYIFLIHLSVVGQLCCFHIVNNAAINMGVQVPLLYSDLLYVVVKFTGSYHSSIFSFLRRPILFSIVVVLIYIPTNSIWGFLFPTSSTIFVVICVLDDSHSNRSEVESYHCFSLHFLYGQGCWSFLHVYLFIYLFNHLDYFLWKRYVRFICPFLHWVIGYLEV